LFKQQTRHAVLGSEALSVLAQTVASDLPLQLHALLSSADPE
jgi:hypothetical protein